MSASSCILDYVNSVWRRLPKRPTLPHKDMSIAEAILDLLDSADSGSINVEMENYFIGFDDDEKDHEFDPEDEVGRSISVYEVVPGHPNLVHFGEGEPIERSRIDEAVAFYGSKPGRHNNGNRIRPPLETMKAKYRFIKNEYDLKRLKEIEKNGKIRYDRRQTIAFISDELEKSVAESLEKGLILHDATLRYFIAAIMKQNKITINFLASSSWIANWKKAHHVSSRRITKFVATIRHQGKDVLEKKAEEFINEINPLLALYGPGNVFNADQSGFQFEMHTARTLARTGSKRVECVVRNASATTHSYTVLPLISVDGRLHEKLFVCLKEKNGRFPAKGHFKAPNLLVTAHTSHIMTKELMKTFMKEIVFDPSMPKDCVLLLDSWTSWKDDAAVDSITPSTHSLKRMIIPAGCTGLVQPCDVGIFGAFKKVVKTIEGHGHMIRPDYNTTTRDATLKMLSLVYWQLSSPLLQSWIQYSWYKAGYDVTRPPPFKSPSEYFFPRDVARDCTSTPCSCTSFIMCIYCNNYFCFTHFVIDYHKCC